MTQPDSRIMKGARRLIARNLGMSRGQEVTILVDEHTLDMAYIIAEAARFENVRPTIVVITVADQLSYDNVSALPVPLSRALSSAQAVITALSGTSGGTGFRVLLLNEYLKRNNRVAHMPGANLDMLVILANTNYEQLAGRCEVLRSPFLLGRNVLISTTDQDQLTRELHFEMGGWDLPPVASTGIIRANTWGNVPSGEIYVAPRKGTASGELAVNGSLSGHVFGKDNQIILTFSAGKLVDISPESNPAASFLSGLIEDARQAGDAEPDFLCELGIGTNDAVEKLTGISLLDEKMFGTAHIAIGANRPFGGDVFARHIHEDIVFQNPTVSFDSEEILDSGILKVEDRRWHPNYRDHIPPDRVNISLDSIVEWTGVECDLDAGGVLARVYYDGQSTRQTITVGDNETAIMCSDVYDILVHNTVGMRFSELLERLKWEPSDLGRILFIMDHYYGIVRSGGES